MPSFRSPTDQAKRLVNRKVQLGRSKRTLPKEERNFVASIATKNKYVGNMKRLVEWLVKRKSNMDHMTPELAVQFLEDFCQDKTQKSIDGYRQSIFMTCGFTVPVVLSMKTTVLEPRAYLREQIQLMCESANQNMQLAMRIATHAGLRAHELDTISLPIELDESDRPWLAERFSGRDDEVHYVVDGKGGLCRKILLTHELSEELEKMRLAAPIRFVQREIPYVKRYDLIGGQRFSASFTRLSNKVLGWSVGGHGLRFRYAQDRMQLLQSTGFKFDDAIQILSHEMGHFSIKNTLKYLR